MKKIYTVFIVFLVLGLASQVFAKGSTLKAKSAVTAKKEKLKGSAGIEFNSATFGTEKDSTVISQKNLNLSGVYQLDKFTTLYGLLPIHSENHESAAEADATVEPLSQTYLGRIQLGAQRSILTHETLGKLDGVAKLILPTMTGYSPEIEHEFFNFFGLNFGARNYVSLKDMPAYISGALIYKAKFAVTSVGEQEGAEEKTIDFGDEIAAAVGFGYSFASSLNKYLKNVTSFTELEYSHVAPISVKTANESEEGIVRTVETLSGLSAIKLRPSFSYALNQNTSINLDSSLTLYRGKVMEDVDLPTLWGSIDNASDARIQLGVTFGLL